MVVRIQVVKTTVPQAHVYMIRPAGAENSPTQVRDERDAAAIIRRLAAADAGLILAPPPAGATPWWCVDIETRNNRRGQATYRADYHKSSGCPSGAVAGMMETYAMIKSALRKAKKEGEQCKP